MGYREYIHMRVTRPNYAREADPGNGFHLLHEVPTKQQLSFDWNKRIPQLSEEQFEARQVILPKKQAVAERRIRERAKSIEKSISAFKETAMPKGA